jgi:HEAT repeat protein
MRHSDTGLCETYSVATSEPEATAIRERLAETKGPKARNDLLDELSAIGGDDAILDCARDPREHWAVRAHAAELLGRTGDGQYAEDLAALLRHDVRKVRVAARDGLIELGDSGRHALDAAAVDQDEGVRKLARSALRQLDESAKT